MRLRSIRKIPHFIAQTIHLKLFGREKHKQISEWQFDFEANGYDEAEGYEMVKEDYPAILEELKAEPFSALLDCGCGTGAILAMLSGEFPDRSFTGIDLSAGMLEVAKRTQRENLTYVQGDCENLPFPENAFDVILCSHSFHHYPHPNRFFASAYSVLRPGGRLILCDNTGGFFYLLKQNYYKIPILNYKYNEGDVRFYSTGRVRRMCRKAGFAVESMEERSGHKLFGTARKPEEAS